MYSYCKQFNERSGTKLNFIEYPTAVVISDTRDQAVAEAFFKQAMKTTDVMPGQITTDKESALYPAINNIFGDKTKHRDSKYMNNRIEQNHRGIKSRYKPMKGFKDIWCAMIFCYAFEEIQQFFRMIPFGAQANNTRAERRNMIVSKINNFNELLTIAV